jgi:hypothetical protein
MTDDPKHRKPLSRSANAERSQVVANVLMSRLKGDGKAVGLNVDEVALECISKACWLENLERILTEASPVWQQAATLEPQACWMGTATMFNVSINSGASWWKCERTDGNAEAVQADEVLAAVAAGDLLAIAAVRRAVLGRDIDFLVAVRSAGGGCGVGNSGHGGDEERLEEGHCEVVGLV